MNNIMSKVLGVLFLILGYKIIILQNFSGELITYSFLDNYIYFFIGFILFYIGYLFLNYKKLDYSNLECSKCPQCKEIFNYNKLKKMKCTYCDDIDTIDIEEYYKKCPEELGKN